jgi:subtilase family serine protease
MSTRRFLAVGGLTVAAAAMLLPDTAVATHPSPIDSAFGTSHVCGALGVDLVACTAIRLDDPSTWQGRHVLPRTTDSGSLAASNKFTGYSATDLQSAYGLTVASASQGTGKTVVIVDAFDDPNAASDLAVYRSTEGLPGLCGTPYSGTSCVGSFKKLSETGGTTYPKGNNGWASEISLDLDMVSAICPQCNIVLVEATTASVANMGTAENEAVRAGALVISNSWGQQEIPAEKTWDSAYFDHPGVTIVASSGDNAFGHSAPGVSYPASSPLVTAVGGTSLTNSGTPSAPNWSEAAWNGAVSGCSKYEPAPSWQFPTRWCTRRTVADASAVADSHTGVAVYDTYKQPGWGVYGGTSVAAPIIASVYALAGGATNPSALYAPAPALREVTTGSNAACGTYLCNAADSLWRSYTFKGHIYNPTWYNGPTGNGTPQGVGSF